MANKTGWIWFKKAMTVGSTPATGGQAEYKVKSGLGVASNRTILFHGATYCR